jgi:hypothetical protein
VYDTVRVLYSPPLFTENMHNKTLCKLPLTWLKPSHGLGDFLLAFDHAAVYDEQAISSRVSKDNQKPSTRELMQVHPDKVELAN